MKDDRDHLVDMSEALQRIKKHSPADRGAFERDELIQCWVVHHLRILCQSAEALSLAFRGAHSRVPWARFSHLGKVLDEHYFDFDREMIWKAMQHDLPPLGEQIERILKEFGADK